MGWKAEKIGLHVEHPTAKDSSEHKIKKLQITGNNRNYRRLPVQSIRQVFHESPRTTRGSQWTVQSRPDLIQRSAS